MTCKFMKCPIFLKTQLSKIIKVNIKSVCMFAQLLICVQLFLPHGLYPTRLLCPWNSPGVFPNPGIESGSPTLQADSLPSEPSGKPQNILRPSILYIMRLLIFVFKTFTDYVITDIFGSIHSSTLAWKIPWTEEPGSLQSIGPLGVGHD